MRKKCNIKFKSCDFVPKSCKFMSNTDTLKIILFFLISEFHKIMRFWCYFQMYLFFMSAYILTVRAKTFYSQTCIHLYIFTLMWICNFCGAVFDVRLLQHSAQGGGAWAPPAVYLRRFSSLYSSAAEGRRWMDAVDSRCADVQQQEDGLQALMRPGCKHDWKQHVHAAPDWQEADWSSISCQRSRRGLGGGVSTHMWR